jgi:hypothetical protein
MAGWETTTPVTDPNKILLNRISDYKKLIAKAKGQVAALNKTASNKNLSSAKRAAAKAAAAKAQKELDEYSKKLVSTEQDYYKKTGQYDKLLSGANRDAYAAITALFNSYGLSSLAPKVYDYIKNGYSPDTISILLQDTKEYKTRFAGNEARIKAGLPVLTAAEYLATEASYRQIMQQAGLPKGFYDQPSDFTGWIGNNVSPSEVQQRVDLATQATILANPNYKKALNAMGIADSELTAYFLDQKKSLPYIQKAAATAQIGAQALSQNLAFDQKYAETLATQGITADQAAQGYAQIAGELDTFSNLAGIYGSSWDQREAEKAIFQGDAGAIKNRGKLASRERANFRGSSGAARGAFSGYGGAR